MTAPLVILCSYRIACNVNLPSQISWHHAWPRASRIQWCNAMQCNAIFNTSSRLHNVFKSFWPFPKDQLLELCTWMIRREVSLTHATSTSPSWNNHSSHTFASSMYIVHTLTQYYSFSIWPLTFSFTHLQPHSQCYPLIPSLQNSLLFFLFLVFWSGMRYIE